MLQHRSIQASLAALTILAIVTAVAPSWLLALAWAAWAVLTGVAVAQVRRGHARAH